MTHITDHAGVQGLLGRVLTEERPRRIRLRSIERIDAENGRFQGRFSLVTDSEASSVRPAPERPEQRSSSTSGQRSTVQDGGATTWPALIPARPIPPEEELPTDGAWGPQPDLGDTAVHFRPPVRGNSIRSRRSPSGGPWPVEENTHEPLFDPETPRPPPWCPPAFNAGDEDVQPAPVPNRERAPSRVHQDVVPAPDPAPAGHSQASTGVAAPRRGTAEGQGEVVHQAVVAGNGRRSGAREAEGTGAPPLPPPEAEPTGQDVARENGEPPAGGQRRSSAGRQPGGAEAAQQRASAQEDVARENEEPPAGGQRRSSAVRQPNQTEATQRRASAQDVARENEEPPAGGQRNSSAGRQPGGAEAEAAQRRASAPEETANELQEPHLQDASRQRTSIRENAPPQQDPHLQEASRQRTSTPEHAPPLQESHLQEASRQRTSNLEHSPLLQDQPSQRSSTREYGSGLQDAPTLRSSIRQDSASEESEPEPLQDAEIQRSSTRREDGPRRSGGGQRSSGAQATRRASVPEEKDDEASVRSGNANRRETQWADHHSDTTANTQSEMWNTNEANGQDQAAAETGQHGIRGSWVNAGTPGGSRTASEVGRGTSVVDGSEQRETDQNTGVSVLPRLLGSEQHGELTPAAGSRRTSEVETRASSKKSLDGSIAASAQESGPQPSDGRRASRRGRRSEAEPPADRQSAHEASEERESPRRDTRRSSAHQRASEAEVPPSRASTREDSANERPEPPQQRGSQRASALKDSASEVIEQPPHDAQKKKASTRDESEDRASEDRKTLLQNVQNGQGSSSRRQPSKARTSVLRLSVVEEEREAQVQSSARASRQQDDGLEAPAAAAKAGGGAGDGDARWSTAAQPRQSANGNALAADLETEDSADEQHRPEASESEIEVGSTPEVAQPGGDASLLGRRKTTTEKPTLIAGGKEKKGHRAEKGGEHGELRGCEEADVPQDWNSEDELHNLRDGPQHLARQSPSAQPRQSSTRGAVPAKEQQAVQVSDETTKRRSTKGQRGSAPRQVVEETGSHTEVRVAKDAEATSNVGVVPDAAEKATGARTSVKDVAQGTLRRRTEEVADPSQRASALGRAQSKERTTVESEQASDTSRAQGALRRHTEQAAEKPQRASALENAQSKEPTVVEPEEAADASRVQPRRATTTRVSVVAGARGSRTSTAGGAPVAGGGRRCTCETGPEGRHSVSKVTAEDGPAKAKEYANGECKTLGGEFCAQSPNSPDLYSEILAASIRKALREMNEEWEDVLTLPLDQTSASEIYDAVQGSDVDQQAPPSRRLSKEGTSEDSNRSTRRKTPMSVDGESEGSEPNAIAVEVRERGSLGGPPRATVATTEPGKEAACSANKKVVSFADAAEDREPPLEAEEEVRSLAVEVLSGGKEEEPTGSPEDVTARGSGKTTLQRRPTPHTRGRRGTQPGQTSEYDATRHEHQGAGTQVNSESEVAFHDGPKHAHDVRKGEDVRQVAETLTSVIGLQTYRRADCRFTVPGCPLFVGVESKPASFVAFDGASTVPIGGAERTRVLVLIEHADSAVEAVRSRKCSEADAAALELPGLLRDLSAAFVLHMRAAMEPSGFTALDGVPTALAVLVRLVEVLDVLVAPEEDLLDDRRGRRRSRGGEAAGLVSGFGERSDSAVAALGGGLGPRGFLLPCLDCLGEGKCFEKLGGVGAQDFAAELAVHAALAVRLVLSWTPPLGVPRPCDVLLAIGGHAKLLSAATGALSELKGPGGAGAPERAPPVLPDCLLALGRLALVLDALRLGLRSDTCVDKLLRGSHSCSSSSPTSCGSRGGLGRASGSQASGRDAVAPLAPVAVEALERTAACETKALGVDREARCARAAMDASATASVRLLAVLVDLPLVAASARPNCIAGAVKRVFEVQPLSMRLTAAVRQLVCHQRRSRGWFGDAGGSFHRSLRCALAAENVPGECVHAALRALSDGHLEGLFGSDGKPPQSVKAEAAACGERCVVFAALYENVEAIAVAVHGHGATSEEDLTELRSRCEHERGEQPVGSGIEEPAPARRSLRSNLGQLRGKIRETCMAPYIK